MGKKKNSSQPKQDLVSLYREALAKGVSLDELDKKVDRHLQRTEVTKDFEEKDEQKKVVDIQRNLPFLMRIGAFFLPISFIAIGLFLVGNAVVPILSYYVETVPTLARADLTPPVPREQVLDVTPVVIAQATGEPGIGNELATAYDYSKGPTILDAQLDYTNLANWFGDGSNLVSELQNISQETQGKEYSIDIPSLDIENAEVVIGGTDLNTSLIQYPGTASPGEAGAPVIFGHSVLRQFYNPSVKNPRRYVSIFSKIMTLTPGDEIFITYEGVKYKYIMREKTEVKPEDVYILTQNYDAKQLKLVTCTPEGTYLRRGVVTAQLVNAVQANDQSGSVE